MRDQVNARGEDGDSPLHIACLYGQAAVVEECIKRGADVNARDEDDSTPLHDAAAGGFEAIVAQLLLKGASTSAKDNEEDTPLHHAARGGHAAVVEKLLAACSDRTAAQHGQMCRPWQRLSSAPSSPQGARGGSRSDLALPRREPAHGPPSHCPGYSSPPRPTSLMLLMSPCATSQALLQMANAAGERAVDLAADNDAVRALLS